MSVIASTSPALLIGFDPRTVLAVARSLYSKGVPVIVGTISRWETPIRSRAIQKYVALPGLDRPAAEFLSAVLRVIDDHDVDTLIPINDRALLLLAPHHTVLSARLRLACPWPDQIASALNMDTMSVLAAGLGIPLPVAIKCERWADLEALRPVLRFPLVAKSRDKAEAFRHNQMVDPRLQRFENYDAMRDALAEPGRCDRGLLLQESCPGDDVGLAVLMHAGVAVTVFQYRARRTFPSEGGECVLACTEKVDTQLAGCATRLLRTLSWEGVAQLNFRHDPATGRFALLEINGHFCGSTAVAVAAGLDFPFYAWQLAHGQPPKVPSNYRTGLLVRWLEGDVRRLLERTRHVGQSNWLQNGIGHDAMQLFAGFRPSVRDMVWSWIDPLPFFDTVANLVCWRLVARGKELAENIRLFRRNFPVRSELTLLKIKRTILVLLGRLSAPLPPAVAREIWRFLRLAKSQPLSRLTGLTYGGTTGATIVGGRDPLAEFSPDRFFASNSKSVSPGNVSVFQLPRCLRELRATANLTAVKLDRVLTKVLFGTDYLRVPEWIRSSLPIPQSVEKAASGTTVFVTICF